MPALAQKDGLHAFWYAAGTTQSRCGQRMGADSNGLSAVASLMAVGPERLIALHQVPGVWSRRSFPDLTATESACDRCGC
jgi:hypothetical protein